MKKLSFLILVFSIAFLVFFFGPPLLNKQFGLYPLSKTGDWFDILTPLVLIPLYWLLYRLDGKKALSPCGTMAFLVLAAFWAEGQGMHLSANSIGHLLQNTTGSDAYNLTYFYDEVLGHYLWHIGVAGLSALLIFQQWRNPFTEERGVSWLPVLAGVIYGFAFFVIVVEGQTTPLGIPFSALAILFCLTWGRKNLTQQPILLFFLVGYILAVVLFAGWGIYWHGFPGFYDVGIVK